METREVNSDERAAGITPLDDKQHFTVDPAREGIVTGIQKLLLWGWCSVDDHSIWIASNQRSHPVIQQGPECGIAALSMAVAMLRRQTVATAISKEDILMIAKEKGYTMQGEMFSAKNMLELALCIPGAHGRLVNGNMTNNMDDIISHMANGWPVLVPYDKDGNGEPCCQRGHKAHWAVLTGFVLHCKDHQITELKSSSLVTQDTTQAGLYHIITPTARPGLDQAIRAMLGQVPIADVFVLARHGKSSHLVPWRYEALADSNANLVELGGNIVDDIANFEIPECGIEGGLCSQVVCIAGS